MRTSRVWILIVANFVLIPGACADDIQGKVLQDHTGNPLPSAEIKIWKPGVRTLAADLETDREGRFRAPGLPAGEYRIEVSKPSHVATAMQVQLVPGAPVVFRLVRCGTITGKVIDSQNRPVRGANVRAILKPAEGPLRISDNLGRGRFATVSDAGDYRLYDLPPGQYVLTVTWGASTVNVGSSGNETIDPAVGSGVLYFPTNGRPQTFTISGGEEFRHIDFSVGSATLYTVSGKVVLPEPSRARYWLSLAPVDQPAIASAVTQADPEGAFRFRGIAAGSYFLLASGPSNARNSRGSLLPDSPYFSRTRVDVAGQNIEDLSIVVEKGRSLTIRLRRGSESQPTNACPQSASLVLTGTEDWAAMLERVVEVGMGGEQIVSNLAPSRYHLSVAKAGDACYATAQQFVDLSSSAEPLTAVVTLAPAGSIRGRLDTAGAPPASFAVILVDGDGFDTSVKVALPDAESRFAFAGLRPGRYRIAAQPVGDVSKSRWLGDLTKMLEFNVRGGAPTEIDLAAPPPEKNR